jgi:sphinganine-1-phosphate aldolase
MGFEILEGLSLAQSHATETRVRLPESGRPPDEIYSKLDELQELDIRWGEGRVAALVFLAGEDVKEVARTAYDKYFSTNGLSPKAFRSLERLESEVVDMACDLLNGPETATGNITSGGTESIIMAIKSARDQARAERPEVTDPEIVVPFNAHPAFNKGGHYLGVRVVRTPLTDEFRVDLDAYEAAISDNTIMMAGSAPNYPHGMIDQIPEMAAMAEARGIRFHVDACVGGFFLPFLERAGTKLIPFDFRVPGVSTISADLHKFGYSARGASLILSRNEYIQSFQKFTFSDWSAGVYQTPTIAGSRPGGAVAASWAVMQYLGMDGYTRLVEHTMEFIGQLINGIERIPTLEVRGKPDMSLLSYGSSEIDIYAVAELLEEKGWFVHRDQHPQGIHLMLSPGHSAFMDQYLKDVAEAVEIVQKQGKTAASREANYG